MTYHDLRLFYLWEGLKKDVEKFVSMCPNCEQEKAKYQKSGGFLQNIQIPTLKWEDINMEFLVGFPRTKKSYALIKVIIDMLTKCAHFIPVKSTYSAEDYARIFIDKIECRHDILLSIILDRGAQFISRF